MKSKLKISLASLFMLTAVGCADNDIVEKTDVVGGDFTLEIDLGTESRAYYDKNGDNYGIFWNEGDKVYVSSEDGKSFGTLKLVDGSNTTKGKFTGSVIGQKKKLNYVVYPVPDKDGNIDLTTRSAEFQNPPMVATLGEDKTKASFEATVPAIQLKINNLPQGETLVVKAKGISGAGKVVKGDDEKFDLVYTTDSKNKITVTDLPGGDQTIYVPVITEGEESEITTVDMTLSIGEAKYKKEVRFMNYKVTEVKEGEAKENSNGFLQLTYIAAEDGRAAQLIEAWDTKADISWYNEEDTEFAISKASELAGLAILVNEQGVDFEGKTVKLGASIDLDGELWTPVGKYAWESTNRRYFKGTFDGQGYTISNLYANSEYAGLFECVWGATIRNVVIKDAEVVGSKQAGAISAYVYGNANSAQATTTVENVTVTESTVNESENEPLFGVITSFAAVNVIEDGETTRYTSNSKLNALLAKGGEVTLDNDVVCNTEDPLVIPEGVSVTLNLNGKKIENGVGVAIKNLGTLTIEGSGVVNATKDYAVYNEGTLVINGADVKGAGCINSDAGEVTIQSGVFKATDSFVNGTYKKVLEVKETNLEIFDGTFDMSDVDKHNSIIGYGENSEVILHGGVFKANDNGNNAYSHIFEGYAVDGSSLKINGGTFVGAYRTLGDETVHNIEINGGDFDLKSSSYFKPKDVVSVKGGTYTTDVWKSYVAEGYSMVENGGHYMVGVLISVEGNLGDALNNEPVVNLGSEIDNGSNVYNVMNNTLVLNMNDQKVTAGGNGTMNYAFNLYASNVEVNDANLDGAGFAVMDGSNLTVNNGTIDAKPGRSGRNMFYVTGGSTVTVNEGTYTLDVASCYFVYVDAGSVCYINGGTFSKPLANDASRDLFVNSASEGKVVITGGKFKVDPTQWLAEGYLASKEGDWWSVTEELKGEEN